MMTPLITVALLTFVAVAVGVLAVARLVTPAVHPWESRLRSLSPTSATAPPARRGRRVYQSLVDRMSAVRRTGNSGLARTLRHAGFRQPEAQLVFRTVQAAVALIGIALGGLILMALRPPFVTAIVLICLWGYVVVLLPVAYVRLRAAERMRAIVEGLPGALDLLVICLEAGLAMDAAIVRVATELGRGNPILGGELLLVSREVQAGLPRRDAFRNLADRTGVAELTTLTAILAQSDRLGTSVAQALRVQAESMRTRRRQRAEEQAAKAAVKIVFPLVFCIFPALFVVVLGPALLTVAAMFMSLAE
jgi:tight adherence protein C